MTNIDIGGSEGVGGGKPEPRQVPREATGYTPRKDSGWADIFEISAKNWGFAVGYYRENGDMFNFKDGTGYKTEHNCTTAMEAAYQRMKKIVKSV